MRITDNRRLVRLAAVLALTAPLALVSSTGLAEETPAAGQSETEWVGTWATGVTPGNLNAGLTKVGLTDQTSRMIVRTSTGGDRVRFRMTNVFGEKPLVIGRATVALPNVATPALSDVDPATVRELRFGGSPSVTVAPGTEVLSDPVAMVVGDLQELVVSSYFPVNTGLVTFHFTTRQHSFLGTGDQTADTGGTGFTRTLGCCWFFLAGVEVAPEETAGAVAVLGDSIADGFATTFNAHRRWPDLLAERLVAENLPKDPDENKKEPGVLDVGISGNRLLHDGPEPGTGFAGLNEAGPRASARFDRDVLSQPDIETVITHLGINDIWMSNETPEAIIGAIRDLAARAKERGVRFIACTITPYEGYTTPGAWTPERETTRQAVNAYLRGTTEFDGLIDFDAVLRDPAHPSRLLPAYDSGDHIHPNDAGNQAMADAVDIKLIS